MITIHDHDRSLYAGPKGVPTMEDERGSLLVRNTSDKLVPSIGFVLVLLLVFIVFCTICVVLCRERPQERNSIDNPSIRNEANRQPKKTKRTKWTQEAIEKNLILKQVIVLDGASTEPQADTAGTANHHGVHSSDNPGTVGRRKCDLVIRPRTSHKDELDESKACSICLGNYEHGDRICYSRSQKCIHRFHLNCAVAWLTHRDICPVCRAEYLMESVEENVVTGTARYHSEHQDNTTSAGGAVSLLPIAITQEEGDIESGSPSLRGFLDGNVHGRHLREAGGSRKTDDEATQLTADDSDASSDTIPVGDGTEDALGDDRVQSNNNGEAGATPSVRGMGSVNSTTSAEQIVPCPSTGSDNV